MASTASISGLVSGLDSSSLVTQLMQIEAQPQNLLKTQLTNTKADADAYRDVNTAFQALSDAAKKLTLGTTWGAAAAKSSSTAVAATAGTAATPGSLTFTVSQLAATHAVFTDPSWSKTTDTWTGGNLSVSVNGAAATPIDLSGAKTLADAVATINAKNAGVTASTVDTGSGLRLQLTATASGRAGTFDATFSGGSTTPATKVATQGQNAVITVGTTNTYDVESATNTFAGVLTGTTFTLSDKPAGAVTVTVASDPDAVANSVQALVTAANAALDKITKYTSTTSSSSTAAVLKGDFSLTSLAGQVLTAVSSAVGGDGSAAKAGLQTDRYGKLVFDATAFKKQLATDPALAQRLFTGTPATKDANGAAVAAVPGVAARLQTLADKASNTTTGTLVSLASGQDTRAKDLQAQIDDWDTRLAARQATLTAQFTAMETALSTLKNQSSWLSSQLGSLTTSSSKS